MKKGLLLTFGLVLSLGAFAQVAKSELRMGVANRNKAVLGTEQFESQSFKSDAVKSVVVNKSLNMEIADVFYTNYDLQSNAFVANRMYQKANGDIAVVATMSHEANQQATDRGTGYNFYSGGEWGDEPESRIENIKTGWPSIAQYGANGEILACHADGIYVFYREVAGEGEWLPITGTTGKLPVQVPQGYTNDATPSWPRIATSGANHDIIHIAANIQFSGTTTVQTQIYFRSENGTDWTCNYSPLAEYDAHEGIYSADDYAIAANGDVVAILYSGSVMGGTEMFKSTDNGLTWERTMIWENPYYNLDWTNDPASVYTDTLFAANNAAIAIDNNGMAHVAMNCFEFAHQELGDTYNYWYGLAVDGVYYWNETHEAPIQSPDGNPHHALRLWWPIPDQSGYVAHREDDSIAFCGWIKPDPETYWTEFESDKFYKEADYINHWMGLSATPAIAVDPAGNVAVAYSCPDMGRDDGQCYYRSTLISYKDADSDVWMVAADNVCDDPMYQYTETVFVNGVQNPVNENEFIFSYSGDDVIGLYWGTNATQPAASDNYISVVKVASEYVAVEETEAKDVVNNIYPNPATDYICISAAMSADATITFSNLAGQTVKSFNKNLSTGNNTINIDLASGVYFCTVSANGFSKTTKVVVK